MRATSPRTARVARMLSFSRASDRRCNHIRQGLERSDISRKSEVRPTELGHALRHVVAAVQALAGKQPDHQGQARAHRRSRPRGKAPLQGKPVARRRTRCARRCFSRSVRPRGVTPDCCSIRAPATQARYGPPAISGRERRRAPPRERNRPMPDRARAAEAGALFGLARRRPLRSIDAAAASA